MPDSDRESIKILAGIPGRGSYQEGRVMTGYKVILECKQDGKTPIITPYNIGKEQYNQIMKIIHETSNHKEGGKYPFMNKKSGGKKE